MKRLGTKALIVTGLLAGLAQASPVEQRDERLSEPPRLRGRAPEPQRDLELGAYLGVSATYAPAALQRQLGLPAGMGLVVEFVARNSPADQAGLKRFDLLRKLDDQLLVSPEQLAVLVRSHKVGDEIKLLVLRGGKELNISVKLVEHEVEALPGDRIAPWDFDERFVVPPRVAPRVTAPSEPPQKRRVSTLTWIEGNRTYTMVTTDGRQSITVKDKVGAIVFEGPVDTAEQRDRLPADVRDVVEKMSKSGLLEPASPAPQTRPAGQ